MAVRGGMVQVGDLYGVEQCGSVQPVGRLLVACPGGPQELAQNVN